MAADDDAPPAVPEWVVTFGDMMSLLLTFFIMLVSLSEVKEEERYQALVASILQQFGHDSSMTSVAPGTSKPRNSEVAKLATQGRALKLNIMKGGDKVRSTVGDHPRVRIVRPGTRSAVGTVVYFPEESAELDAQAREDLRVHSEEISGKPQKIEIRGHTSQRPTPLGTEAGDNWDLAYERCRNTFDYMVQELKIDPRRLRMSVAGPNEPLHIDADPIKLQQNPRVEIFVLDEIVTDLVGTEEERQRRYTEAENNSTP